MMWSLIGCSARRSSRLMPRTSPPRAPPPSVVSSTWPSSTGVTEATSRQCADPGHQLLVVVELLAGVGLDRDVAVDAEDARHQFDLEAAHDRGDDDQRRDAEGDADQGENGDDRDEALAFAGAQIAAGDRRVRMLRTWVRSGSSAGDARQCVLGSQFHPLRRSRGASVRPCPPPRRAARRRSATDGPSDRRRRISPRPGPRDRRTRRCRRARRTHARTARRTPASPTFRLRIAALNGAMLSGQMMPSSSWLASITAPTSRDTPTP